ncbi:MAG: hypothetical protein D6712_07755 [Chloroflexi bacterium]|nr:MAG: hypothetical protein D6712_07755 [Chloroflexota bacterium]
MKNMPHKDAIRIANKISAFANKGEGVIGILTTPDSLPIKINGYRANNFLLSYHDSGEVVVAKYKGYEWEDHESLADMSVLLTKTVAP